jgi:hypothetical protein
MNGNGLSQNVTSPWYNNTDFQFPPQGEILTRIWNVQKYIYFVWPTLLRRSFETICVESRTIDLVHMNFPSHVAWREILIEPFSTECQPELTIMLQRMFTSILQTDKAKAYFARNETLHTNISETLWLLCKAGSSKYLLSRCQVQRRDK